MIMHNLKIFFLTLYIIFLSQHINVIKFNKSYATSFKFMNIEDVQKFPQRTFLSLTIKLNDQKFSASATMIGPQAALTTFSNLIIPDFNNKHIFP